VHENTGLVWIGDDLLDDAVAALRLGVGDPIAKGWAGQVLCRRSSWQKVAPSVIRYCKSRICGRSIVG
jgi:hypothetical protein